MHVACLALPGVARAPQVNCMVHDELIIWLSMWYVNDILMARNQEWSYKSDTGLVLICAVICYWPDRPRQQGINCDHASKHDNGNWSLLINSPFYRIIESRVRSLRHWSRVCWLDHLWSLSVVAWLNFETWNSKLSDSHVVSTSFDSPCNTLYIHIEQP